MWCRREPAGGGETGAGAGVHSAFGVGEDRGKRAQSVGVTRAAQGFWGSRRANIICRSADGQHASCRGLAQVTAEARPVRARGATRSRARTCICALVGCGDGPAGMRGDGGAYRPANGSARGCAAAPEHTPRCDPASRLNAWWVRRLQAPREALHNMLKQSLPPCSRRFEPVDEPALLTIITRRSTHARVSLLSTCELFRNGRSCLRYTITLRRYQSCVVSTTTSHKALYQRSSPAVRARRPPTHPSSAGVHRRNIPSVPPVHLPEPQERR